MSSAAVLPLLASSAASVHLSKPKTPRSRRHPGGQGTEETLSPLVRVLVPFEHEVSSFYTSIKIPIRWRPRVIWWGTEPITPRPDLHYLTTYPSTPPDPDTHPILILVSQGHDLNSQTSLNSSISRFSNSQMRSTWVSLLRVFISFSFQKNKCCFGWVVGGGGLHRPWDPVSEKSYHHLGLSPMRPNELWTCPDNGAPGYKSLVVSRVVVGPFEEEEEGTGVTSDVVKVQVRIRLPQVPVSRNDPGTVTIPQYRFNKNKVTHTIRLVQWLVWVFQTKETKKESTGLGQVSLGLADHTDKKMRGYSLNKKTGKSGKSWSLISGGRGYGSEFGHQSPSWNQIQTLKNCFFCHIFCALFRAPEGPIWLGLPAQSLIGSPSILPLGFPVTAHHLYAFQM